MQRFTGKVALVTGGGSGIGAATVSRLVEEGAQVCVVDRNLEPAQAVAARWAASAIAVRADVTQEDEVERAVLAAVARFGRLDIAVNAAGYGVSAEIVDMTLAQWQGVIDADLTGVFLSTKHQARQMLRQGAGGVIVNIASTNAVQPGEGLAAYCAAKAGVAMFTQVAAMELGAHGIRVVGVGPGLTETPLTAPALKEPSQREAWTANIPSGRAAQPAEIAGLVAWLASSEGEYVNGETMYIDGGLRTRRYPTLAERRPGGYPGPEFLRGPDGRP